MPDHQHLYLGRSGERAVITELLYRGYNVAVPEVDVGEDLFVVRENEEIVTRVQVKAAEATEQAGGFWAQFNLPKAHFTEPFATNLVYVLAVHHQDRWAEFIIIHREVLKHLRKENEIGSLDGRGNLILRLAFTARDVQNKGTSFQAYRNAWEPWPPTVPTD